MNRASEYEGARNERAQFPLRGLRMRGRQAVGNKRRGVQDRPREAGGTHRELRSTRIRLIRTLPVADRCRQVLCSCLSPGKKPVFSSYRAELSGHVPGRPIDRVSIS